MEEGWPNQKRARRGPGYEQKFPKKLEDNKAGQKLSGP